MSFLRAMVADGPKAERAVALSTAVLAGDHVDHVQLLCDDDGVRADSAVWAALEALAKKCRRVRVLSIGGAGWATAAAPADALCTLWTMWTELHILDTDGVPWASKALPWPWDRPDVLTELRELRATLQRDPAAAAGAGDAVALTAVVRRCSRTLEKFVLRNVAAVPLDAMEPLLGALAHASRLTVVA